MEMKQYACKFCMKWTNRIEARKCIKKHILIDKSTRENKRSNSNITNNMVRREVILN